MDSGLTQTVARREDQDFWEIPRGDPLYPACLEELHDPPKLLRGKGNVEALSGPHISVIGARRATPYGLACASMAGRVAAECGITLVSGGAMGCDAAAARGALALGAKTVVVSGVGADRIYPASSKDVFEGAVENGGAVISLVPWGQEPRRWAFPQRNQVIAALGDALFVTEAGLRSGTSSTASTAVDLGRRVYAVPGSIFSPQSAGTNQLIADGASIVTCEQDLEAMISLDFGQLRLVPQGVKREESRVLSALLAQAMRPDDLATALGEDPLTLIKTLSDYESRGIVSRLWDGRYAPSKEYLLARGRT